MKLSLSLLIGKRGTSFPFLSGSGSAVGIRSRLFSSGPTLDVKEEEPREPRERGCDRAITYFDLVYSSFYGERRWERLRAGLLAPPKYFAVPNPYTGEVERISKELEEVGALSVRKLVGGDEGLKISWPPNIEPFVFPDGSGAQFPKPKIHPLGVTEYICINGSSLFPFLAMDLKPSCEVLDVCAGPGAKSILFLMSQTFRSLTCNDVKPNRVRRVRQTMKAFTGSESPEHVELTNCDGAAPGKFDRILVDVPCLNDRASLSPKENNIFNEERTEERFNLANTQKTILISSLESLKGPGSVAVYSTCTLHPVENDGVIMQALNEMGTSSLKPDVGWLLEFLRPFVAKKLFKVSATKYGTLIEPNVESNFGPMYVSRIVKTDR